MRTGKLISVISTIRPVIWSNRASEPPQCLTPNGVGKISGLQTNEAVAKYLLTKTTVSPKTSKEAAGYLPITEILYIVSDQALNTILASNLNKSINNPSSFINKQMKLKKTANIINGSEEKAL